MQLLETICRAYIASYETGQQDKIAAFLHPAHMYYPPGGGSPMTREERIDDEHFFFSAFTDIKAAVADIIIQDDKAAVRIIMTCTHTGEFHGVKATGRRITIPYMELIRFEGGLIKDEWAEFDMSTIITQLQ
ncbi:MAG: ester cyclase [Treponema sp.]|nr:ester cyclase [Treponema sp.]